MSSNDFFHLHFLPGETTSQEFAYAAGTLDERAQQVDRAVAVLFESGLRGTFVAAFQDRSARLLQTLRTLADEVAEAGSDLRTVVERARLLDAQIALQWMQGGGLLADSGGGAGRLAHVGSSIARLETLQTDLRAKLAHVQRQKDSPVNTLLGLRDDYAAMEMQLSDTISRNEARLEQLRLEQQALGRDAVQVESGFAKLLREPPGVHPQVTAVPSYADYSHRQYATGDTYGCTLYAQASVMEAMGFDFTETLDAGRSEGVEEGWYDNTSADGDPASGTQFWALGDMFESNGVPVERMGGTADWSGHTLPDQEAALERLQSELQRGRFPVVSFMATEVALYDGQHVNGHTVWVTGVETDAQGVVTSIVANDSHFGRQVTLPADQFVRGWSEFKYQAVFARQP